MSTRQKTLKTAMIVLILAIGTGAWTAMGTTNELENAKVIPNVPFTEELKGWTRGEQSNVVFKVQQTAKGAALCVENKEGKNAAGNVFISIVNNQSKIPLRAGMIYSMQAFYTLSEKMDSAISLRFMPLDADGKAIPGYYFWLNGKYQTTEWKSMEDEWAPPSNAVAAGLTVFFNGKGTFQITALELKERMPEKTITFNGQTFFFTPRNKEKDPPLGKVSRRGRKTGLLIYQRDPRMVYPDSVPQPHEVIKEVAGFGTPGERKGLFFMVYALRNVDLLGVKLESPLVNRKGETIPAEAVTIKEIKFWPQRTGWNSLSYYIIPELLEESTEQALSAKSNRGFWLDVKTPSGIGPGDYKTELTINTGSGKPVKLPLRVKILPFELMPPEGIDWIMTPDINNIKRGYTDGQLRRYLLDMKEYGISGLCFAPNQRLVGLIREIGFTGPMQVYLSAEGNAAKKMGITNDVESALESREFRTACAEEARVSAKEIRNFGLTNTFYQMLTDEPGGHPDRMRYCMLKGEYLKEAGVPTWCTAYTYKDVKQLAPILNADTPYFADSEEENRRFHDLADQYKMKLWLAGDGAYPPQTGGLMPSRYLAGFLLYKSGAEALSCWTYQRPEGDPFTDFDGEKENPSEPADKCITYPARTLSDQQVTISTLQWEGIREGVIDYKYLYTLKRYIDQTRAKGLAELADESARVLDEILNSTPWQKDYQPGNSYLAAGNFNNDTADALRWMAARQIEKIVTALNSH